MTPKVQGDIAALQQRIAELESELAQVRAQSRSVRAHEGRLWAILKSIPMLIGIHDADMTIRYINRTARNARLEQVLGQSPLKWIAQRHRDRCRQAFDTAFETGAVQSIELTDLRGAQWSTLIAPLTEERGKPQALSCTVEVTEHKLLEAQVRQAQKVESLGTLAGAVAHDFNNLLVAILGNADLGTRWASEGRDPDPCFNNIREAAQRAAALCRQMLAYSGHERTSLSPQDLNDVVGRMTQLMRAAVSARIELNFELLEGLPPIQGDNSQLGQVVMNLITNAAEAIGPGHGRVTVRTDIVEVGRPQHDFLPGSPKPGTHAMIEVADDGRGMDAQTRSLVFDPFFTSKDGGHGLGLSAVLGIVRSHGAAIRVRSAVGKGTTFTVLFPLLRQRQVPERASQRARKSTPGFGSVLVVDDETAVRELASEVLREEGYTVLEAENGEDALQLLNEYEGGVRAVLLDVTMPRRDGLSTLGELRRRHPTLPVVLSSGRDMQAEQNSRDRHLRFLGKPYSIESLLSILEDAISDRQNAS